MSLASHFRTASRLLSPSLHRVRPLSHTPSPRSATSGAIRDSHPHIRSLASSTSEGPSLGGFTYPAPRKLSDIAKLQLLEKHSSTRVSEIWNEYHHTQPSALADVLLQPAYDLLFTRAKRCPLFVIPVPRDNGFFTLLVQFQQRQVLLTFLDDYKRNAANAMPYMTVTFFDDFLRTKGVALVRSDVTHMMTKPEAKVFVRHPLFHMTVSLPPSPLPVSLD